MKQVIVLLCFIGFAFCNVSNTQYLPPSTGYTPPVNNYNSYNHGSSSGSYSSGQQVAILKSENINKGDGHYRYSYQTGNGISAQEQGTGGHQASGSYSYTSPEGQTYTVTYTADENGFHAQGAHLPTPPPIPEAILRSLEYNKQHALSHPNEYGQYHKEQYSAIPSKTYVPSSQSNGGYQY